VENDLWEEKLREGWRAVFDPLYTDPDELMKIDAETMKK
jgi:hypothetical protein